MGVAPGMREFGVVGFLPCSAAAHDGRVVGAGCNGFCGAWGGSCNDQCGHGFSLSAGGSSAAYFDCALKTGNYLQISFQLLAFSLRVAGRVILSHLNSRSPPWRNNKDAPRMDTHVLQDLSFAKCCHRSFGFAQDDRWGEEGVAFPWLEGETWGTHVWEI